MRIASGTLAVSSVPNQAVATRKRGARTGRNPRTRETIKMPAGPARHIPSLRRHRLGRTLREGFFTRKYYAAYRLTLEVQEAQKQARESVKQGG